MPQKEQCNILGIEVLFTNIENPKIRRNVERLHYEIFLFGWDEYHEGSHRTWSEYSEHKRDADSHPIYTESRGCGFFRYSLCDVCHPNSNNRGLGNC